MFFIFSLKIIFTAADNYIAVNCNKYFSFL